jgi:hypothetical protein
MKLLAMSLQKSVFILCLVTLLPHLASGTRKYVPDDYPTIQQAINGINSVDSIIVRQGTYQENLVITNKVVKLFSEYIFTNDTATISQTIIDGNQVNRVVYIENNNFQLCIIKGFTIQNGRSNNGGGILCYNTEIVRLENCKIHQNVSTGCGGGISISYNISNVTISDCEITDNYASDEGGGVIVGYYCRVSINNCLISGNNSMEAGGGIYNEAMPEALDYKFGLSINRCIVTNNWAPNGGGFANAWFPNEVKIISSTFYNNRANNNPEIGIWGENTIWVINTIIYNDSALVRNVMGMGAYGGLMRFYNSLVYGGENTIEHEGPYDSLIYSSTNMDTIPCFVDPSNGDFHLEPFSPCIDSAIDTWILPPHEVQPGERIWISIDHVQQLAPEGSVLAGDELVNILPDQYYGAMPDIGKFEYFPPVSVKELQEHESILVYPNPTRDKLNIQLLDEAEKSLWSIFDLRGNVIFHGTIAKNNPLINLDLSGLSAGFYFLKREDEVYKIVKY